MMIYPDSEVRLLNNVPLTNSYEHQMTFGSKEEQTTFFYNKATAYTGSDFTYVKEDSTIKVPRGRGSLFACNYIMFRNSAFSQKWFYGFVTKIEYINPNTSKIYFELDVFQSWLFDYRWNPSFVEREHQKRWNSDGTPVINTLDEGLNYGDDYNIADVRKYVPNDGYKWLVIVSKSVIHNDSNEVRPTVIGTPQPLSYYLVPFKDNNLTPTVLLKGNDYPITPPTRVMAEIYKNEEAVNNVVSIYVTEFPGFEVTVTNGQNDVMEINAGLNSVVVGDSIYCLYVDNIAQFKTVTVEIDSDKYAGFTPVEESKLLMYPYTVTILDDMKGNRLEIRNEFINSKDLSLFMKGSLGTSNKTSYGVKDYNRGAPGQLGEEINNEFAIINSNPNDVPILNEYLASFLQGNRNSLQNQMNSILFNGALNFAGGAVGLATTGGLGTLLSAGSLAGGIGNTMLQIQGIQAKQKDIANQPPSLAKMGANTSYEIGNRYNGVYIIKKEIKPEYRKKLSDFFKMFGYKCNELKTPNLRSRQHFNYIKTVGAHLTGNVPQEDLAVIKRMFDNGVTLWHGDWVGDYSKENGER